MSASCGSSPHQLERGARMSDFLNLGSGCTLRRRVNCSVFILDETTGRCLDQKVDETDLDIPAVHRALNIDLILRSIFAYADFPTLKSYRSVQKSWRTCANFEILRRNCSRTFITPQNLPSILSDIRNNGKSWTSFPSCELVLDKIDSDDSSNYWSKVHQLFRLLCPPGQGQKSQVKSLTFIWPTSPNDDGPSENVIHYFLQILQLVSSSIQELNVTHYLMTYKSDLDYNDLQPGLTFDLPNLKSTKILPRAASDLDHNHERLTLGSRSLGLQIIQISPNLEKVDNFHLEKFSDWPKYSHLVKNYVFYQPLNFCDELAKSGMEFCQAGFPLESLSDSFYLFPYTREEPVRRRENLGSRHAIIIRTVIFRRLLWSSRNTIKELRVGGNSALNLPSPRFPSLRNLRKLQVKIGRGLDLPHFLNPQDNRFNDVDGENNPLPNLKTVSLVFESGWKNQVEVDFDPRIEYRSVTSLELSSEFVNMIKWTDCPFNFPDSWLENLAKYFPSVENLTLTNAIKLERALPSFLGLGSKFKNLRSIRFNIHLSVMEKYPFLGPIFRELAATTESRENLQGLRKLDIIFEDYLYDSKGVRERALISVKALKLFLNVLPNLQMTFHYNHSRCPQELLSWLRPLATVSPKISFLHLSRDPWARAVDVAFYNPQVESLAAFLFVLLMLFSSVAIYVQSVMECGGNLVSWFKNATITNNLVNVRTDE